MEEHAGALAAGIVAALPGWVEGCVERLMVAYRGASTGALRDAAAEAGRRAAAEVGPEVRALFSTDVDEQRDTPLGLLRAAVRYPTGVLQAAGVPPVARDAAQERLFPEDLYDLAPANFADLDPSLGEAGLLWGAAKAREHLERRRGARR